MPTAAGQCRIKGVYTLDYRELPSDYLEKMKKLLKEEFEDYLTCFRNRPITASG